MKKEDMKDIEAGDLVIFEVYRKFTKQNESCAGFVYRITATRFYIGWYKKEIKHIPQCRIDFKDINTFRKIC